MFGLNEISYPAHVLISFLCDSDNKIFDYFTFQNFSEYFSFVHFGYHQNYTPLPGLSLNFCSMHIGPKKFSR